MTRYALIAALTALCGALGWLWVQSGVVATLRNDNAAMRLSVAAMGARQNNITEDKGSDNAIDQIPDVGLRAVPNPCWMLANPDCGGVY